MDKHKSKQLGVRADADLVARLDREADRTNRTRSNLVIHILREALDRAEDRRAPE